MLVTHSARKWRAHEFPAEMRALAYERKGTPVDLELVTWEPVSSTCWLTSGRLVEVRVRLSQKEWKEVHLAALQGYSSQQKPQVVMGSVTTAAAYLWKSGSLEHTALLALVPGLAMRFVEGQITSDRSVCTYFQRACLAACCGMEPPVCRTLIRSIRKPATTPALSGPTPGPAVPPPPPQSTSTSPETEPLSSEIAAEQSTPASCDARPESQDTQTTTTSSGATSAQSGSPGSASATDSASGSNPPPAQTAGDAGLLLYETKNPKAVSRLLQHHVKAEICDRDLEDYVLAEPHKRYRTLDVQGERVHVVLGQTFDKSVAQKVAPRVGVMMGPQANIPNVYAKCEKNVESAIDERLHKKAKPCTFTKEDRQKVGKVVNAMIHGKRAIFNEAAVKEWFTKFFDFEGMMSKKWTTARMQNAIQQLLGQVDPSFKFKTDIKCEVMPENKAPRFLIADGDAGQVMALAVVKCLEDLLFHRLESHSIKHRKKAAAIADLIKSWRAPKKTVEAHGWSFVEGDGSAWDTTCNNDVRSLIEEPVIAHITGILAGMGLQPDSWGKAHADACSRKTIKLIFAKGGELFRTIIQNIRRSGHRGTSVLNYLVNYVLWICSVFEEPEKFLDPSTRWAKDVAGVMRWFMLACEGDDSGLGTSPKLPQVTDGEFEDYVKAKTADKPTVVAAVAKRTNVAYESALVMLKALHFWMRAGFNMKIFVRPKVGKFVGVDIGIKADGPSGHWCPEVPRALKGNVACGATVLDAAAKGDIRTVREIAAATALARAADFAGKVPTLSRKYLEYADKLSTRDFQNEEMSLRCGGDRGMSTSDVRREVERLNGAVTSDAEMELLDALDLSASEEELAKFRAYSWEFSALDDHDGFAASLPQAWS